MKRQGCSWMQAYGLSVLVHAIAVVGIVVFGFQTSQVGGDGMITIDLGGPAGDAGGLGVKQVQGRSGNAGTGGDGAQTFSKNQQITQQPSSTQTLAHRVQGEDSVDEVQAVESKKTQSEFEKKKTEKPKHETGQIRAEKQQLEKSKSSEKNTTQYPNKPTDNAKRNVMSDSDGKNGKSRRINAGAGGAVGASGSANSKGQQAGSGIGEFFGDEVGSGRFIANGDGTYTAKGSGGIAYKILYERTPRYPQQARSIGFNKTVRVRVRFLVGLNGHVEAAQVVSKNVPDLGFNEAALSAVKAMRFEPIVYKGNTIKMLFAKTIVFEP